MNTAKTDNRPLAGKSLDRYRDDGFVFPIQVMSPQEAHLLRLELENIEAQYTAGTLPAPLSQYLRVNTSVVLPLAARLAADPRILDIVQSILGRNLLVWGAEFFDKPAYSDNMVSMHQDLTYWGLGATSQQVTAWIALTPATDESGCMALVRGSHKNTILPHEDTFADNNMLSRGQEVQADFNEEDKVLIELQPGEMSLHHGLAIHGSGPNRSADRRLGFAIRYIAPEVTQHIADRDYAMLVRGEDTHKNFVLYPAPRDNFTVESLALYDQILKDQAAALAKGAAQEVKIYSDTAGKSPIAPTSTDKGM